MDTYFFFSFLVLLGLLVVVGVAIFLLYGRLKQRRERCELELKATKREQEEVYETIAGLTSFSGVQSVLDYIARRLQKLGFSKVLILLIDKKEHSLYLEVARGFGNHLVLKKIVLPIISNGGVLAQTVFYNKFFVVEDKNSELYQSLESRNILNVGSFMAAPLARKSDDQCWEIFGCTQTTCPGYENDDSRCWTLPDTQCNNHLRGEYDPALFFDPNRKINVCLNCERFQILGVMLVAQDDFQKFSNEDKKLFRAFAYQAGSKLERAYLLAHLEARERELTRRMYEISILKELGERLGYSLNTQKIADIITGSLKKLIDYSAASYILIDHHHNKLLFKCQLEETVNRKFVDTVKERMLAGLSALIGRELEIEIIDESLTGTVLDETAEELVHSFFNIPLALGEKVVGMLNVASTRPGLYREDEMTVLYKITAQASNAVTRLQEVLDLEQEKLNAMVLSMADGVLMIDKENRVYVINPKVKKMLGLEKGDVSIFDIMDSLGEVVDFRAKFEESVRLDRLIVVDEAYIRERFLRILFSPVKDKRKKILGSVVIFHDITHDKELEKIREDFTNMMVHDLRSPLNGIRLMTELLQRQEIPQDEQLESIALINKNAANILELVDDLLDAAKLEAGKFEVNKQLGNLQEMLSDQVNFFKHQAQERLITLITQIDRTLAQIKFDRRALEQVLGNLLSNALKFTAAGGKVVIQALQYKKGIPLEEQALKTGIRWFLTDKTPGISELANGTVIGAVTDSGCGIPEEQLPQLFTKFRQVRALQRPKTKGTGLGLVVARGLVQAHGGIIGVESKVGQGSTFFFTLPAE